MKIFQRKLLCVPSDKSKYGTNNIKVINARQAKEIHQYRNIKNKLHKMNAAI